MSGRAGDNSPLALFPLLVSRTRDFGKIHEVHSRWCDKISTAWHDMISKNGLAFGWGEPKASATFFCQWALGICSSSWPSGISSFGFSRISAKPENLYLIESTYCWPQDTILDFCQHLRSVLEKAHSPFPSSYPAVLQEPAAGWATKCVSRLLKETRSCLGHPVQKQRRNRRIWLTWSLFKVWSNIGHFPCQNCKKTTDFVLWDAPWLKKPCPLSGG